MTEEERRGQLVMAITYWFPIRWEESGSVYERTTFDFFGDVTSGGIRVTATKDEGTPTTIDFSNEDCYGGAMLDPGAALAKFLAAWS